MVRLGLLGAIISTLLGCAAAPTAAGGGAAGVTGRRAASVERLGASVAPIVRRFNEGRGRSRFVALLSPS